MSKKYKVRELNIMDIRTIAKILKEAKITREEVRNAIGVAREEKDKKNYIHTIMPLLDVVIDILIESETLWEFLKDIIKCEDLKLIPISDIKEILSTLFEDMGLISFFTGVSTQEKNLEKSSANA